MDERLAALKMKRRRLRDGVFVGRLASKGEGEVQAKAVGLIDEWRELLKKYEGGSKVVDMVRKERRTI